jgi:hypothetical protein
MHPTALSGRFFTPACADCLPAPDCDSRRAAGDVHRWAAPVKLYQVLVRIVLQSDLVSSNVLERGQTMNFDIADFCFRLEMAIQDAIQNCYPHEWDEDHITRDMLRRFRNEFAYVEVTGFRYTLRIEWQTYKFTGRPEYKYGDIAILVNLRYKDGTNIQGVAFLEAKRRANKSNKFDAINFKQIRRIRQAAPNVKVLLYDYESITETPTSWNPYNRTKGLISMSQDFLPFRVPETNAVVVPASYVADREITDTSLYKFALPLSHQICCRYFIGQDLEFSNTALDTARGFTRNRGIPAYIMTISVGMNTEPLREQFGINRNLFRIIE